MGGFLHGFVNEWGRQQDIKHQAQMQANKELANVYELLAEKAEPAFQDQYLQRAFALRTLEPGKKPPKDLTDIAGLVHQQVGTTLSAQNQQQAQAQQAQQQQYAQRQQEAGAQVKAGVLPRTASPTGEADDESQLSQLLGGTPPQPPPGQAPAPPPSPDVQGGGFAATLPTQNVVPGGQGPAPPPGYAPAPGKQFTLKNPMSDLALAQYQQQQALLASQAAREDAANFAKRQGLTRPADVVNAAGGKTVAETPAFASLRDNDVALELDASGKPTGKILASNPRPAAAHALVPAKDFTTKDGAPLVWDPNVGKYRDMQGSVVLDPVFRGDPNKPLDRQIFEMNMRLQKNPNDAEAKAAVDTYYQQLHQTRTAQETDDQKALRNLMALSLSNQINTKANVEQIQDMVQRGVITPEAGFQILGGSKSNVAGSAISKMANQDIETPAIKKVKEEYELPISDLESLKKQLTPRPGETVLEALQRKNIAKANADLLSASLLRAYGERGATTENDRKVGQATLGAGMLMTLSPETAIKNIDYMIGRMRAKLDEKLAIERGRPAGGPPLAPPTKKNGPPEGPPGNQTTAQPIVTPVAAKFKEGEEKQFREKSTGRMFKWKLEKGKVVLLGEVK